MRLPFHQKAPLGRKSSGGSDWSGRGRPPAADDGEHATAHRVLPMLVSNLGVWVPAVCIIYALPTALQLPLQNLVLCFFTLLLAHISKRAPAAVT